MFYEYDLKKNLKINKIIQSPESNEQQTSTLCLSVWCPAEVSHGHLDPWLRHEVTMQPTLTSSKAKPVSYWDSWRVAYSTSIAEDLYSLDDCCVSYKNNSESLILYSATYTSNFLFHLSLDLHMFIDKTHLTISRRPISNYLGVKNTVALLKITSISLIKPKIKLQHIYF